ncbi:MAG: hypothetical protein HY072_00320 [Deltaproteobacteria bacterium]|nr:hypothetical protein [Deltaproteobacteria bacterium]
MKEIKHELKANPYFDYKRAFVLKIAYEKLGFAYQKNIKKLTPAEQIMLDTYLSLNDKINQFDSYFHRLPFADMFLLLIRDKHGLPYPEITAAMNTPEDSLKTQRQMAYRTLEEWIWETQ